MARFDMDRWLQDEATIGARFASRDLRGGLGFGLFSPDRMKVPEGVAVRVTYDDGSVAVLEEGEEAVGAFQAVAVKTRPFRLLFELDGLLSREDLPFRFTAEIEAEIDAGPDGLQDFAGAHLAEGDAVACDDLRRAFLPEVAMAARNFVASREAADLARRDHTAEIEVALHEALRRDFFEGGITLREVEQVRLHSDAYERILEDKIEATVEEEKANRREIIRAAWIKDQKDEILSHREVQDLMRALEHEGALKEIERRREQLMAEGELQKIAQDSAQRKLAEEARTASNMMKILEEAGFKNVFEKFLEIARGEVAGSTTGVDPRLHGVPEDRTHRILCAAGREILAFEPRETRPAEVHALGAGDLGMLRSVQCARQGSRRVLVAGAQFGVYLLEAGRPVAPFRIPGAGDKRGGVNAAAVLDGHLFATHSDYGLLQWPLEGGEARFVRPDLTAGKKTVRGVQTGPLGRLLFAADAEIYSFLPGTLEGPPTVFAGASDSITALVATERSLFAGTAAGDVLRWEFEAPGEPPTREIARRPDPVFMVKTCSVAGLPRLLVGWKGYGLLAKALETETEVSYPCETRVRWVDGASDFLYGVDRDGRRLFAWEAADPRARPVELRSRERIQDIAVQRESEAGAPAPDAT